MAKGYSRWLSDARTVSGLCRALPRSTCSVKVGCYWNSLNNRMKGGCRLRMFRNPAKLYDPLKYYGIKGGKLGVKLALVTLL